MCRVYVGVGVGVGVVVGVGVWGGVCHLLAPQPPVCVCVIMAFEVRTPAQVRLVKRSECQARYSSYNNELRSSRRILGACACTRLRHVVVLTAKGEKMRHVQGEES
jgi:hypothetical protein